MTAQDMIMASQLTRVRELQTQLKRAAEENARLARENEELKAHFDLALLAAEDLRNLAEGGRLVIVDGWNMILGDTRHAPVVSPWQSKNVEELIEKARRQVEETADFVWIVLDGHRESVRMVGGGIGGDGVGGDGRGARVRVSYTGGSGMHRADRLVCDFVRMARYRGMEGRIEVVSNDKEFLRVVGKICSR